MRVPTKLIGAAIAAGLFVVAPAAATASETVYSCSGPNATFGGATNQQNIFTQHQTVGIQATDYCQLPTTGQGLQLNNDGVHTVQPGAASSWSTTAPTGMVITDAAITLGGNGLTGTGYEGILFWTGGTQRVTPSNPIVGVSIPNALTFGWELECAPTGTTCPANSQDRLSVQYAQLTVADTVNPSITALGANNLWYQGAKGWVRGAGWPIAFQASAPSGIAAMAASLQGTPIQLPYPPGCNRNQTVYEQCPSPQTWSPSVALPINGPERLALSATSAAGASSSPAETIYVDNTQPTIALSGPTGASSAQGTQYVTATATTGPSGLSMVSCSVDGGPAQRFTTSPAQVPVAGLGQHTVTCAALNHAVDASGQFGSSALGTWHLDIGQPTSNVVSFARIANALHCTRTRKRVKVRVHHRAVTRIKTVRQCHARYVQRRVTVLVKVKRHGHTRLVRRNKTVRVAVLPRTVQSSMTTVRYGHAATVHGWLGTAAGVALPGRSVQVLTAPDNQLGQWTTAATVTTDANGGWSARLPAGPSRLVRATFGGDATDLAADSKAINLRVPAPIALSATPRAVEWSGTVVLHGHLIGGEIPPDGVAMRLLVWLPGRKRPYSPAPFRTNASGAFSVPWSFASGVGVKRIPMSVATVAGESDYAYSPSSSRRVIVTFGAAAPSRHVSHRRWRHRKHR